MRSVLDADGDDEGESVLPHPPTFRSVSDPRNPSIKKCFEPEIFVVFSLLAFSVGNFENLCTTGVANILGYQPSTD